MAQRRFNINVNVNSTSLQNKNTNMKPLGPRGGTTINDSTFAAVAKNITVNKMANKALSLTSTYNSFLGEFSEDRQQEREINKSLYYTGATTTIVSGFAAGGPIAGGAAIAAVGIDQALRHGRYALKIYKQNVQTSYNSKLIGNTLNNGVRWTGAQL